MSLTSQMPVSCKRVIGALALAVLAGCGTVRVEAQHDPTANFSAYRTYGWKGGSMELATGSEEERTALDRRIRIAIERQLAAQGFQKSAAGTPDFLVGYHATVREVTVSTFQDFYRYRQAGGSGGPQEAYVYGYEEGSLVLDIVEPTRQHLLWRGSASVAIDPMQRKERFAEAVRQALERFPPR